MPKRLDSRIGLIVDEVPAPQFSEAVAKRHVDAYLADLQDLERSASITTPSTQHMEVLSAALGYPQRSYRAIHVTGTNGKGSTANMAAALLASTGLRVGLYTSPHLQTVNERISINGRLIADIDFAEALDRVRRAAAARSVAPTWFEAVTIAALWHFQQRQVDAVVIEVGMLGRWDATNVIDAAVAVVTNVELDHTELAGPTRAHIAEEKSGIIWPGSTLVLGEPDPSLRPIFEGRKPRETLLLGRDFYAERVSFDAPTIDVTTQWTDYQQIPLAAPGTFQATNAAMALTAVEAMLGRPLDRACVTRAFGDITLAGRSEVVGRSPAVIVDCVHNEAAASALRPMIGGAMAVSGERVLLCGLTSGHDPLDFLVGVCAEIFDYIIVTEPDTPRAVPIHEMASAAALFERPLEAHAAIAYALERAVSLAGPHGVVIAVGSYYLAGPIRAMFDCRQGAGR